MTDADRPKVEVGNIMSMWCRRHWKPFHGRFAYISVRPCDQPNTTIFITPVQVIRQVTEFEELATIRGHHT